MENLNMKQLIELEKVAATTQVQLQLVSDAIAKFYPNREISLVKTKIEEAMMWLEKYQEAISFELDHKISKRHGKEH